ncbi:MAG: hypothetical protein DM484_28985 [Candidatus Methylumidiphilus alinenensis]|uniref:Uncharacterized protein n=1 Tax=Candidatus Methylumidiphilus alinenensis TaxID=2202197 RepID=A0A2W4QHH9_9GAMM|nr:MAG: hypothetical protein DM484_28985 [Candidatus Methylumidiphilus alinenensis]
MTRKKDPTSPNSVSGGSTPINSPTTTCPLADKIKIVELVEVVAFNGSESTQPANGRKQYINLDNTVQTDAPHPEYGRSIRLKARVEWVSDNKSKSLSGQTVYWYSTSGGGNKTGLTGGEQEGFGSAGGGKQTTCSTDDKGWTGVVSFYLSQYGGDKFDLNATDDSGYKGGLKAGTYIVWRKLWFEVDTMKKRGSGTLDMDHANLPALYEPCFIELEKQGTDNQPDNLWNVETSGLHAVGNDYFGAERSPFQSHEFGIDHQADRQDGDLSFDMVANVFTTGTTESYYVYDGSDTWLKTAQYKDGSVWKNLDKGKVTLVGASPVYKNIKVDLSSGPVTPTASVPITVKLEFIKSQEWSGDGSNTPHAMIAMGYWYDTETVSEAKKRTLGTMAHELGHLVGMVPTTSSTHIDTGTGDHCTDTGCVMYYTNTTTRGNNFCAVCIEVLKKADLTTFKGAFTHTKGPKA